MDRLTTNMPNMECPKKLAEVELTCQQAPYIDQALADFYQEISQRLILPELAGRLPVTFFFFAQVA